MRPQLHVLTDFASVPSLAAHDMAELAFRHGADVVQLRDKSATAADLLAIAQRLQPIAAEFDRSLIVNDYLDVAREAGCAGVHLGVADLSIQEARALWPRPAILGASARTEESAARAQRAGADYLGCGPIHGTTSKPDAPAAIGLVQLAAVAAAVSIPVIAIGGIRVDDVSAVLDAGASGIAVISAVWAERDPAAAIRALRAALDEGPRRL